MLAELLRLLDTGGLHATADVARRLEVSETLVIEMAGALNRRGYLALLGKDCSNAGCAGCAVAATCGRGGRGQAQIMALTDKGRQAVRGL